MSRYGKPENRVSAVTPSKGGCPSGGWVGSWRSTPSSHCEVPAEAAVADEGRGQGPTPGGLLSLAAEIGTISIVLIVRLNRTAKRNVQLRHTKLLTLRIACFSREGEPAKPDRSHLTGQGEARPSPRETAVRARLNWRSHFGNRPYAPGARAKSMEAVFLPRRFGHARFGHSRGPRWFD